MTKPSDALRLHRDAVRRIVADHRGSNPRVFGSTLRGDDTASSDLDLLIDPMPDTTLFDIGAMRLALRRELGVAVDVLTPAGLPEAFRAGVVAAAVQV